MRVQNTFVLDQFLAPAERTEVLLGSVQYYPKPLSVVFFLNHQSSFSINSSHLRAIRSFIGERTPQTPWVAMLRTLHFVHENPCFSGQTLSFLHFVHEKCRFSGQKLLFFVHQKCFPKIPFGCLSPESSALCLNQFLAPAERAEVLLGPDSPNPLGRGFPLQKPVRYQKLSRSLFFLKLTKYQIYSENTDNHRVYSSGISK